MSKEEAKLITTDIPNASTPVFVEAEAMFVKLADITRQTAARAYDFFMDRGAEWGSHFEDWLKAESMVLRPAPVEITETAEMVTVKVAVPGFKANEIEVSVKDNDLILSGEAATEAKQEGENTFYTEWSSNQFLRHLTLPSSVDATDVKATLTDGVLHLSLKKKATEEAVKVAVQTA